MEANDRSNTIAYRETLSFLSTVKHVCKGAAVTFLGGIKGKEQKYDKINRVVILHLLLIQWSVTNYWIRINCFMKSGHELGVGVGVEYGLFKRYMC